MFRKMFNKLKKTIPWTTWSCQYYQGNYLILETDMRELKNTVQIKTFNRLDFIKVLMNQSKCSKSVALDIALKIENPSFSVVALQYNKKDLLFIKPENLRNDLKSNPLFT